MAKAKRKQEVVEEVEEIEEEVEEIVEEIEYESTLDLILGKYRNVLIGVGAFILAAVGVFAFLSYQRGVKGKEARSEMYKAVQYFEADSLQKALNGDGAYLGFLDIESEYSGTDEADLAKYYLGIINIRLNNLDEGIEYLEAFPKSDALLSVAAYTALGFAYEDTGDPQEAARNFERAASVVDENEFTTPKMWLEAGRNYEAAGMPDKAAALYTKIKEKYPNSTEGATIDKYLGRVAD
ncbi:MAG: tetratricopeptide repeat protein [Bacteroidota bacterium]